MKKLILKIQAVFRETLTRISPFLNTKVCYRVKFGKSLDLDNPSTFNEKILWLKLNEYMDNPLVKQCADKYQVRRYISNAGFGDCLIPLLSSCDSPCIPDWGSLPNRFVLKLNVGCGHNLIVNDKACASREEIEKIAEGWFKSEDWLGYSEMQYKDVPKKLLVEANICSDEDGLPKDYKFFCMDGECKCVMICEDRDIAARRAKYYFLDKNWSLLPFSKEALENPRRVFCKPSSIDKAFAIAESIAKGWPFVRVDLYIVDERIYFGEMTFTPAAGMDTELGVDVSSWLESDSRVTVDDYLGSLLDIKRAS
ncbi:ATP-grasp fold amidoligase family protein [Gordonibacter massiliensis (ex Traore et al. 2017)]|uniref:Glycosyl transferase n=1 Tax=Gordonibacter massiliensis (ex Traore et al. 2017) TaxID=1841863 RepID=A0A842JLE5_9ACTN|nr:ATP-grasp fold amidoligase family protein [Gordonibacter massiliensis (ex Traore et al. 2017)]MBC2890000.1 glycosyl transferase [Gordonibacter massiliensis (ex Traore et al. 2017)]